MADGRSWIAALPPRLSRQGGALAVLLDFCEASAAVSSFSVGCSLGRGASDELSDVDAAIGVDTPRGTTGADLVRQVEAALVDHLRAEELIDIWRDESSTGDFFLRRLFAQLRTGVQLDLAVIAEAEVRRGEAAPDFVSLYRTGGHRDEGAMASAYLVSADQIAAWTFQGWRALLDADKYLRRASAWEAHQRLHEARQQIWALWAAARGTSYPQHGLSQVLDQDPPVLPENVEATVSGLDLDDLRAAARACAAVLDDVSVQAARRCSAALPTGIAAYTRSLLQPGATRP